MVMQCKTSERGFTRVRLSCAERMLNLSAASPRGGRIESPQQSSAAELLM